MSNTPNIWKKHSVLKNVWVSSLGYIVTWDGRHKKWFEPRRGNKNGYGYMKTKIQRKSRSVHLLVCETFHGQKPGVEYTVDHINRDKTDNRACNLRWATKSEQSTNRATAVRRRDGTPVWIWKCGCGQDSAMWFENACVAADSIPTLNAANIRKVANGEYKQTGGYKAVYDRSAKATEIPGEIFRRYKNIGVSQFGRLKNIHGKILTPKPLQGQVYASYDNESFHCIVARVWWEIVGPDPGDSAMTVDHINRDKFDNRACNLRWASKQEQRANQSN